jgi:hypothetical protein
MRAAYFTPLVLRLTSESMQLLRLPGLCAQAGQQPAGDGLRGGRFVIWIPAGFYHAVCVPGAPAICLCAP